MSKQKNELIPVEPSQAMVQTGWSAVRNIGEAIQIAELVAKSASLPDVRNAGVALLKIMAGGELGFGAFASLVGVHIIEGKPSLGSHLIAATIKRSDRHDYEIVCRNKEGKIVFSEDPDGIPQNTDDVCELAYHEHVGGEYEGFRKGKSGWRLVSRLRYTLADARRKGWTTDKSGKEKGPWLKTPRNMLFARNVTDGYKTFFPDLVGGVLVYTEDELDSGMPPVQPQRPAASVNVVEAEFGVAQASALPPIAPAASERQVARLKELVGILGFDERQQTAALKARGVSRFEDLTSAVAGEMLEALEGRLKEQKAKAEKAAAFIEATEQAEGG